MAAFFYLYYLVSLLAISQSFVPCQGISPLNLTQFVGKRVLFISAHADDIEWMSGRFFFKEIGPSLFVILLHIYLLALTIYIYIYICV